MSLDESERAAAQIDFTRSQYHISRRFAMAFSVFSLAVFAMPLGIRVSRTETYANIALALAVAMGYYFALIIIGWTERSPHWHPHLLVWLPNLLAQAGGFWLLHRVQQR
jgi:lipopolysaccharide export system permease protein